MGVGSLTVACLLAMLVLAAPASADEWVELRATGFDPPQITVEAGETIHFASDRGTPWTVTSDTGLFDSKEVPAAGAFSMALSVPGTHVYRSQAGTEREGRITVLARSLPGDGDDPATAEIPDEPFPPALEDDVAVHPAFGVEASKTRIVLGFTAGATVGEVNRALADADVTILGGLPSIGVLLVAAPESFGDEGFGSGAFNALDDALARLRSSPGVNFAAMSTVVRGAAVPPKSDHGDWNWDDPVGRGNWGLVGAHFPEAWNLLERLKHTSPSVITGIVDLGFEQHDDLPSLHIQPEVCDRSGADCLSLSNSASAHSDHVAGIIGAAYDNAADGAPGRSRGVTGANPVARMYGYPALRSGLDPSRWLKDAVLYDQNLELFARILGNRPSEMRVVNYSMGAAHFDGQRWQDAHDGRLCGPGVLDDDLPDLPLPVKRACTPDNDDPWQREMANVGRAAAPIVRDAARQGLMIVAAAGNDGDTFCPDTCRSVDAASRSEFGWVSRHWDDAGVGESGLPDPVFVVQSIDHTGGARFDSNVGGDIAAPGDQILSTVLGNGYGRMGGTSMAAPYVTGLIGYLLADDPSLSIADVRRLVVGWAGARPEAGPVDFTWSMPDRMNRDRTGDKLVDYPTARFEVEPQEWDVELDACSASVTGKPIGTYTWSVDGQFVGATGDCVYHWHPRHEGTYSVKLTATAAEGAQDFVVKQVKVEDLLIVSVGDSIASGEGNPDIDSPHSRWQQERCHRSAFAGPAQAARWLESADARTSVTFVHLACSGGRIQGDVDAGGHLLPGAPGIGGLLTPYEGVTEDPETSPCAASGRTDLSVCEPPQIAAARALVGDRKPDALLVSIGANDMWFSSILKNCLIPFNDCTTNDGGLGLFQRRIQLLPARYAALAADIHAKFPDLPPERVIVTQYPDLTTDENGVINLACGVATGIDPYEAEWAHNTVIPALNGEVAKAAQAHGWTVAAGIPSSFERHGYCSSDPWIVDITGSVGGQAGIDGAFHPNYAGHTAYARKIIDTVRDVLQLGPLTPAGPGRDRAPRLDAYRPVAGNGPASRVVDVNDPSKDGNRRVERTLATDGTVTEREDSTFSRVAGDKTEPDGRVDMRDVRRFRDAWLQRCVAEPFSCPPPADISLDGGDRHPKRDLNLDGCVTGDPVGCDARESRRSRFDYNGDGEIDPLAKSLVPWKGDGTPASGRAEAARMTDLEVIESSWTGGDGAEGWKKEDLQGLLRSADLEVHPDAVLDAGAAKAEVQVREKDGAPVGAKRVLRRRDGFAVMTVPLTSTGQEYELVTTANTARGAMTSVSPPFTLKYGEDRLVAVCPDISLQASPTRLPAGGGATSVVTATVHKCKGREDVEGKDVTFTLDPANDGATLDAMAPKTDAQGAAQAIFTPGTQKGTYTVKVSIAAEDGADPLTAELEIEVVPLVTIRYVWKQTIQDWDEQGSTRWGPFDPLHPDCTAPGMQYCIDGFHISLAHQAGVQRAGTLTGGGDRFKLTEQVSNSSAGSASSWSLAFPDGTSEDGAAVADWFVTDPDAYEDHPVDGLQADDETDGIRLSGMQSVGDLPYHYALFGGTTSGGIDPVELHSATNSVLLIPQAAQKIRFAAQPGEDLVFDREDEGFKPFASCGTLNQNVQTERGYYVAGASDYVPGATTIGRKPDYAPGDRPMPVGPRRLKVDYAFAAVVAYAGQPVADPVLPDCSEDHPPVAAFDVDPAGDGPAKEGRQVTFHDRSTDPERDIQERSWDFGDGATESGTSPLHMFEDDGTYTVTLKVTDAKDNTDTTTRQVVVENEPPEASIDDVTAEAREVTIYYRMLDPGSVDKQQLHYKLSSTNTAFPTQQGVQDAGVWHLTASGLPAGTYPLKLTVTDKDGASATDDAVAVLTAQPPPPPPPPPSDSYPTCDPTVTLDGEEREFLDLVNDYRAANSLAPVGVSATLTKGADRHSADMAAHDFMAHTGSDGSSPGDRAWGAGYPRTAGVGENIAEADTAFDALWAWRGSHSGHNENMLDPRWKAIGISRAEGSMWRWATSYGTVQDCPAAGVSARQSAAPRALAAPAAAEPEAPRYPPTVAFAIDAERPQAGKTVAVHNRSLDASGTPIAASFRFGDTDDDPAEELAAGASRTHTYPEAEWQDSYWLRVSATDASDRTAQLRRLVSVDPILAPYLDVRAGAPIPVAGRPYTVEVDAYDQNTWTTVRGLELTFTLGTEVVHATTDEQGLATAIVHLAETEAQQTIEIAFAGTDAYKPATEVKHVTAKIDHAPVARAGGPYVAGEGGSLMLNGARSTDEDPSWFDHIVSYEWDLDGDGDFGDLEGRLPRVLEGDELDDLICGGACDAGRDYPISLRVTDSHGARGLDTTSVRFVADFDVLLGGESKTIVPGQSNSFAVTVIGSRSYDKPVTLSVEDLPAGVTASFSTNPITPTGVSVLTLTGSEALDSGTFPLHVTATDGVITKEVTDELNVAFGLVPICQGTIAGVVKNKTTGAPLAGVSVVASNIGTTTDASGRYELEHVPLGWNNAPQTHWVSASKLNYWDNSRTGEATCGAVTRVDLELLDVRTSTVNGSVIDKETRQPLPDATLSDVVCTVVCTWTPVAQADDDGRFQYHPKLGFENSEIWWTGRAEAPGYWYNDKAVPIAEGQTSELDFELVKRCFGKLKGGQVRYTDTNAPAAGAAVSVYVTSLYSPDMILLTDEDGHFTIDRTVALGYENQPTAFRLDATPGLNAPPGTRGGGGSIELNACGDEASAILYLPVPKPNFGAIEGHVTDEETGAPMADTWVQTCIFSCESAKTDDQGFYRFDRVRVGEDQQTGMYRSIAVDVPGYYAGSASAFVTANETTTMDVKLLKRRTSALHARVVDAVTGTPIPGALVSEGYCSSFCFSMDRSGERLVSPITLGSRNAPLVKGLTASAEGYWEQTKTVTLRPDETAEVEYRLQPECEPAKVVGTVVNAETQAPIQGAQVGGGLQFPVFTDAAGHFVMEGIRPSTGNNPRQVYLTASASGFFPQSKQITIFCGARITVDFGSRTSKTGTIVGTVTDAATGGPLRDTFIGTDFGGTAKTDDEGNYRIEGAPLGDLNADREWSVIADPPDFKPSTKKVTVSADQERRLDFAFSSANERPAAEGQALAFDEDHDMAVGLHGTDPDGDALTYHVMRWPEHGRVQGRLPNITYTPDSNYHGTDSLEFLVNDGVASSERATVTLQVRSVNDNPFASADFLDAQPDTTTRIPVADLLANDVDVDGEPLKVVSVQINESFHDASATLDGDEVVFTPPPGLAEQIQFAFIWYTIEDAAGVRSSNWVYIRVDHGPAAPRCVDRSFTLVRGQTLDDALACTDVNGDALTYALVSGPQQGDLDLDADGTFTYAPPASYVGTTTFTFKADDGDLESAPATVTITVREPNAAPACTDAAAETTEDVPVELELPCTDADQDPLGLEPLGQPAHGTLAPATGGRYRYTPAKDFSGADSFTFRATDEHGQSAPATARVTVRPVNDPPAAEDGVVSLAEDAAATALDLAAHAQDLETPDAGLAYEIVTGPSKGALAGTGANRTYTPQHDFNGTDTLTFRVTDRGDPDSCAAGAGCSAARTSSIATIRFEVAPRNDLPVCADLTLATDEGTPAEAAPSCSDVDQDALTYEVASQGAKGVASVANGKLRFAPGAGQSGEDAFSYVARDGQGASAPARVAVTVRPRPNAAPVTADDALATDEDAALAVPASQLAANDTDEGPLTVTGVGDARHGSVTLAGGTVTFVPDPDFNGAAGFAYTVADHEGATATGRAAVTVRPVNDAPVAAADEVGAEQDRELAIATSALLANDRDADGDGLGVTGVSGAEHGSVSIDGSQVRFAPAAGFHGAARFVYEAGDGHGGAGRATVTVNVAEARIEVKGEKEESGGDLLLGCSKRAVVLEDVVPAGRRVKLFGVTERKHAGQRAEIRFLATGKVVARPVVGQDGRFAASAPMPSGRLRHSNKARYDARIGGERSLALKLERRMLVTGVHAAGGKVTITGKVIGPLAKKPRDRAIEIQRRRTCSTTEVVARVMPGAGGRFRATVSAPTTERAAVYRLRTKVRRSAASPKLFETFTLPRAVDF